MHGVRLYACGKRGHIAVQCRCFDHDKEVTVTTVECPYCSAQPSLIKAQEAPSESDDPSIPQLIIKDMIEREQHGIAKYGQPVKARNGRDPLVDAYQETLDQLVYIRQEIELRKIREAEIMEIIRSSTKQSFNDGINSAIEFILGRKITAGDFYAAELRKRKKE
jgi:hypothetical protein